MAKKKTKKSKNKNKFEYNNEVIGVLIILVGIIGLLGTGIIGNIVKSFAIFLVGTIYILLQKIQINKNLKNHMSYLVLNVEMDGIN